MENKLLNLLKYVERNNTFYESRFRRNNISFLSNDEMWDEKFESIPILYKAEIVQNYSSIISKGYSVKQLERQQTSGSTGEPLWVYKSESEINRQSSYVWRYRMEIANVLPADKYVRSYISKRKENYNHTSILQEGNSIALNMLCITKEDLRKYYEAIVEYEPKWLFFSPSFLLLITNFIKNNNLKVPKVGYIELTGEYVPEALRHFFKEIWKCQVSIHYGCREVYAVATECKHNHLHIVTDNVLVEIVNKGEYKDDFGEVVVTSLNSKAMPLIRYNIGDIGRVCYKRCSCGSKRPYIELLGGRKSEYIEIGRNRVHSSIFHFAVKKVNTKNQDAVLKFQVLKLDGKLQLRLELRDDSQFNKIAIEIEKELSLFIPPSQYDIKKMNFDGSYIKSNGKFAYVM